MYSRYSFVHYVLISDEYAPRVRVSRQRGGLAAPRHGARRLLAAPARAAPAARAVLLAAHQAF